MSKDDRYSCMLRASEQKDDDSEKIIMRIIDVNFCLIEKVMKQSEISQIVTLFSHTINIIINNTC